MIKSTALIIGIILLVDICGFFLWKISGQQPTDSFYLGAITNSAVSIFHE